MHDKSGDSVLRTHILQDMVEIGRGGICGVFAESSLVVVLCVLYACIDALFLFVE